MAIEEASPAGDTLYEFLTRERILSPYNPYIITTECVHMNTSDESRSFETYLTYRAGLGQDLFSVYRSLR